MKKRIFSAILLSAMLISLASCGETSDGKDTSSSDTVTTAPENPAGIPKSNYDKKFTIFAPDEGMYRNYFFTEEAGSDAMSKAIYDRQLAVEEHLGVKLDHFIEGSISQVRTTMQETVMSGDDTFQLALTHCISGISAMLTDDLLYDFNDFEFVDMTNPWWNQSACESLAVKGHNYYGVSDYMLPEVNLILFNIDMITENNLENPYDIVREGKWTIDKMLELMSDITADNGDGTWDHLDTWGLGAPDGFYHNSFIYSCGTALVDRGDDGRFELAFNNERTYNMIEKLDQLLNGSDTWVYKYSLPMSDEKSVDIAKGRSLFNIVNSGDLFMYRETTIEYGILPFPKLEESQDGYYTNNWSGLMCVPKTVQNDEMVGKVIELLSYYSTDTTVPAYFDIVLGEKLSRDTDSKEMLEIIYDGIIYDAGVNYFGFEPNMKQLFYTPNQLVINGSGYVGLASHLAAYQPGAETEIEKFNTAVAGLE